MGKVKFGQFLILMYVDFVVEERDIWYHGCSGTNIEKIICEMIKEIFKYEDLAENLNYIEFKLYNFPKKIYETTNRLQGINSENLLPNYVPNYIKDYERESVRYIANVKDALIIYNFPISNKSFRFL